MMKMKMKVKTKPKPKPTTDSASSPTDTIPPPPASDSTTASSHTTADGEPKGTAPAKQQGVVKPEVLLQHERGELDMTDTRVRFMVRYATPPFTLLYSSFESTYADALWW